MNRRKLFQSADAILGSMGLHVHASRKKPVGTDDGRLICWNARSDGYYVGDRRMSAQEAADAFGVRLETILQTGFYS